MRQDETTYPKRIHVCIKLYTYWKGRNDQATRWICHNCLSYLHYWGYGGSQHHTSQWFTSQILHVLAPHIPHPNILTPHITNPANGGFVGSHMWSRCTKQEYFITEVQGKKVTTMHLTKWMSSWCCYCSARPTHCSSYETGLHSLHRHAWRCHWILNLAAQAMDGHEGRSSQSKFFLKKLYPTG